MIMKLKLAAVMILAANAVGTMTSCNQRKWEETSKDGYSLVTQKNGRELGYCPESGVKLIQKRGWAFKDLNRNDTLDRYEDWRLTAEERATDLAGKMTIDEIAGLMLYSSHQAVPTDSTGWWSSTYNGLSLNRSGLPHSAVSDKQKKFLKDDNLRAILLVRVESPRISAEWNNNLQAFVEGLGHGIPVNISSDPRNEAEGWAEFNAGSGGKISYWPCQLGLAATFAPSIVEEFGKIASKEYRALGIATALSPQADIATEPRWLRAYGTFGEDPALARDMTRAYIDGFQTSEGSKEIADGWGFESVNAMVKHWPGGGTGEGGRDAHYCFGKYSVYPGNNLQSQIEPFINGAFKLNGKTKKAAAVMPYYTISYGIDPSGNNVGNSYSKYIITDLLREKYDYDGVVCTDWAVTHDYEKVEESSGKCWGYETATEGQRHFAILKAGVDQFGGNDDKEPVLEAYNLWVNEFGEKSARERFERSAVRLLMNIFRTGLFDNPYVDPEQTEQLVGCPEFMEAGYNAQLKSAILLKNHNNVLPIKGRKKVYFPMHHETSSNSFFGGVQKMDKWEYNMSPETVSKYFDIVDNPQDADFAFVLVGDPSGGYGYSVKDREEGGNGYMPISLQYDDYTADSARAVSIAGGDPLESFTNRSYRGKTVVCDNRDSDKGLVAEVKKLMGDKPVIVGVSPLRPFVPTGVEEYADAIVYAVDVQHQVFMDIISGAFEPQGLLPVQLPSSMETVEKQFEDVPRDMDCYKDSDGNVYDFAYGRDWSGVINDARVKKYK